MVGLILRAPGRVYRYLAEAFYRYRIHGNSNIVINGRLVVKGRPMIDIRDGSTLYIGNNVTLNSTNQGYHVNMHSPVKLMADRSGAVLRIGDNTRLHGTCIHAWESVSVGKNCLIAANCQIMDSDGHDLSFPNVEDRIHTKGKTKPVVIGNDVWIGANTIVLPGTTIGRGAVIGAGSVVVRDIPPMVVAAGNPATVVKRYYQETGREE